MPLRILNQCLDHIAVSEKELLMKERRKMKNKKSASETRKKAFLERKDMETEINLQNFKIRIAEDRLADERKRRAIVQEQKQV